jgi:hypothetical protein
MEMIMFFGDNKYDQQKRIKIYNIKNIRHCRKTDELDNFNRYSPWHAVTVDVYSKNSVDPRVNAFKNRKKNKQNTRWYN